MVKHVLSFLDCFAKLIHWDRFGNKRIIWDNEFFFLGLNKFEKEKGLTGLVKGARYRYGLEHDVIDPPIIESGGRVGEKDVIVFASGHVCLVHTEHLDLEPEKMLSKISDTLPEKVRELITSWRNIIEPSKEHLPGLFPFWCENLSVCLGTELLGYVYLTPDEKEYVYDIPVKTSDDKKFMMKVFRKMNMLIGRKTTDQSQNQSDKKDFRHKVAKPLLRKIYREYTGNGLSSAEALEKSLEDIPPEVKDLFEAMDKESIKKNYIYKKD